MSFFCRLSGGNLGPVENKVTKQLRSVSQSKILIHLLCGSCKKDSACFLYFVTCEP